MVAVIVIMAVVVMIVIVVMAVGVIMPIMVVMVAHETLPLSPPCRCLDKSPRCFNKASRYSRYQTRPDSA
jgi:hypothetical protein